MSEIRVDTISTPRRNCFCWWFTCI